MHCEFNEGLLGACNRVRFNRYYQDKNEFQMAWQVSSNNNPRMMTTTDYTSRPQRGVATIVPHNFTGEILFISSLSFSNYYGVTQRFPIHNGKHYIFEMDICRGPYTWLEWADSRIDADDSYYTNVANIVFGSALMERRQLWNQVV